jgi:hypothetical protein
MRILFLTNRASYGDATPNGVSVAVDLAADMLTRAGVTSKGVMVHDNNDIDREVTAFQPTHVVIEAFWVVPEKFDELKPLHPTVRWIVRNHSAMPFLAQDGIAIEWIAAYLKRGIEVMSNDPRTAQDLRAVAAGLGLPESLITVGPNVYPEPGVRDVKPHISREGAAVTVSCFGAIRPTKNVLTQAVAALRFADAIGKRLRFVISAKDECGGEPIVKNLRALFAGGPHALVEQAWLPHDEFVASLSTVDIALQVSFSETFNLVAADAMAASVPLVVSPDVPWIGEYAHADPTSTDSIAAVMLEIWREDERKALARLHRQRKDLMRYCSDAEAIWLARFRSPF